MSSNAAQDMTERSVKSQAFSVGIFFIGLAVVINVIHAFGGEGILDFFPDWIREPYTRGGKLAGTVVLVGIGMLGILRGLWPSRAVQPDGLESYQRPLRPGEGQVALSTSRYTPKVDVLDHGTSDDPVIDPQALTTGVKWVLAFALMIPTFLCFLASFLWVIAFFAKLKAKDFGPGTWLVCATVSGVIGIGLTLLIRWLLLPSGPKDEVYVRPAVGPPRPVVPLSTAALLPPDPPAPTDHKPWRKSF